MNEHTPGPLTIRKENTSSGVPRIFISDSIGENDIAEVYTNAAEDMGWPDAKLFAAAPEMYAMLNHLWAEIYGSERNDKLADEIWAILVKANPGLVDDDGGDT